MLTWSIDEFYSIISLLQKGQSDLSDAQGSISSAMGSSPDGFNSGDLAGISSAISSIITEVGNTKASLTNKMNKLIELEYMNQLAIYFRDDISYETIFRKDTIRKEGVNWDNIISSALMVPSTAKDGEKLPLIVWLPGQNGEMDTTDDWYKKTGIVGAINNGDLKKFNGYFACIRSDGVDSDLIKKYVEELSKEYNIDKENMVLFGWSGGAIRATKIASELGDYFKRYGIISINNGDTDWFDKIKENHAEIKGFVGNTGGDKASKDFMTKYFIDKYGFEVEEVACGHDDIRETLISTDKTGDGISDLIKWAMFGDDLKPIQKGKTEEPTKTQLEDEDEEAIELTESLEEGEEKGRDEQTKDTGKTLADDDSEIVKDFAYKPHYDQKDYADTEKHKFGSSTISLSGCGICCDADYLTDNGVYITPIDLAKFSNMIGPAIGFTGSGGASSELMEEVLTFCGVNFERCWGDAWAEKDGKIKALEALKEGKEVIVKVKGGAFTNNGHYIRMTGIEDGKVTVYDPYGFGEDEAGNQYGNWIDPNPVLVEGFREGFDPQTISQNARDSFILEEPTKTASEIKENIERIEKFIEEGREEGHERTPREILEFARNIEDNE